MPQEYRDAGADFGEDISASAIDIGDIGRGGNGGAPEPERGPRLRKDGKPWAYRTGPRGGKSAGTGKEKTRNPLDLSSLTGLFVGIHVIAAGATNVPELAIDMDEGKQFMLSAQNVMRHYSVESSQKTIDWLAFGGTCCMIYGTRFGAYMLRRREEQKEAIKPNATIYQMPTVPRQPPQQQQSRDQQPPPESHVVPEMEFEGE